ncbi:MAG: ankyrin repeat domain-containing protein [Actinomycetota bacterium]|nr:ankyrin repeat domain-containing protein [Actinomycetota bacterium]
MTETIDAGSRLALDATSAVQSGDLETLSSLLAENPGLATARIGDESASRTLLHAATDWPGHFPNNPATVALLLTSGTEVDARFAGSHRETALHWAASSDDVEVLDALLDAGADIEADGGVIANGTPLADAVAFGQWQAAARLVERGGKANLWQAAALGLLERVEDRFGEVDQPSPEQVTEAFWCACHGGQLATAAYLLDHWAELNWVGWDGLTPLDAALRSGANEVVVWLRGLGATSAVEPA